MATATQTTWVLPFQAEADRAPRLLYTSDFGSMTVRSAQAGEEPSLVMSGDLERLRVQVSAGDDGAVHVSVLREMGEGFFRGGWDARVALVVPRDCSVRVRTEAGSVEVQDLDCAEVDIAAKAGRVRLERLTGRVRVHTDAGQIQVHDVDAPEAELRSEVGSIEVDRLFGSARFATTTGRIEVSGFAGSFQAESAVGAIKLDVRGIEPGEHRVRTTAGSIRVEVARGLDVRVDTRAGLGSVRNEVPSRPAASAVIFASTEIGSVRVGESRHTRLERAAAEPAAAESATGAPGPRPAPSGRTADPAAAQAETAGTTERGSRSQAEGEVLPPPDTKPAGGDRDAAVARILRQVEAGEISARDAGDLLRALEDRS